MKFQSFLWPTDLVSTCRRSFPKTFGCIPIQEHIIYDWGIPSSCTSINKLFYQIHDTHKCIHDICAYMLSRASYVGIALWRSHGAHHGWAGGKPPPQVGDFCPFISSCSRTSLAAAGVVWANRRWVSTWWPFRGMRNGGWISFYCLSENDQNTV